ncbi:ABC transporter substrate-binding protein [Cellulosilyticum sp. I15G10I2]|uniref:ABC transporter substrate-binding protein n=1 Tax=Cellulosilyticum sp. I15G10I2 TaxID=1892843 RepID=UPI00085BCC5E|nr:ABC transporter substrate-binding protein [Cellulosilyticum sp. I15G10I2]
MLNLFLTCILWINIVGIQKAAPPQVPIRPPSIYIPVIAKGQAPFWEAVRSGVEKAAVDYGVRAVFGAPATEQPPDIITQLNLLQNALANNPDAIVLAALDSHIVTPYLERARDAGIPVIGFDSGVDSPIVSTTVATDNYETGELAADKMAQLIGGTGKVAIIAQDQTSKSSIDRRDGFLNTLIQEYRDIEVIPTQYSLGDTERATEVAKELLMAHPDVKGVFAITEGTTQGLINAVKDLNKVGEITLIGFDAGQPLINAIREGIVAGAITQDPMNIGYQAVTTAIRAARGENLPAFIDTGFAWYDKFNIDNPEIQPLLYE